MDYLISQVVEALTWLPAIVVALTFHEYAHGRMAYILGDPTAYNQGRLTLNPIPHIDWVGFFMLLIFKFGWAKPVIVNPYNFRSISIKKGMMLVSIAGPLMNIVLAFLAMIIYKLLLPYSGGEWINSTLILVEPFIVINLILAAFNLIPLPPLDGSKVLAGLLPDAGAQKMYELEQYGPLILLLLIFTGLVGKIIWPLVHILYRILDMLIFF